MRISRWFRLSEATRSSAAVKKGLCTGPTYCIDPSWEQVMNARELAIFMDEIRDELGPLTPTSWIRSPDVNEAVGGSLTSAHLTGWAADVVPLLVRPEAIMQFLWPRPDLAFDQAILYAGHVHLGLRRPATGEQRRQFLDARKGGFLIWRPA